MVVQVFSMEFNVFSNERAVVPETMGVVGSVFFPVVVIFLVQGFNQILEQD